MNRALAVLALGAFLTLVFEATDDPNPLPTILTGACYVLLATVAHAWVERTHRIGWSIAYVAVMLPLSFLVFGLANAGVGATLLLLVLVSQSVRLLPLPAAVAVAAAVPLVHVGMEWGPGLRNGLGTLAAAAFTLVVTALLLREQRARAELATAHERLRGYAAQAEELATARERNRLARDIHDGLGHHLTVVQMQVQAARAVLGHDPEQADAVLAKAQQQASDALAEVRRSVAALREPRTVPPLRTALEGLAAETSAAGVPTVLDVDGEARELPADTTETLFRAAQEGLTNVRKHAAATSARLTLAYHPGRVRLDVRDDGAGLPDQPGEGFGLLGLRERAADLGGRVELAPAAGAGTVLRVEVPG